MEALERFEFDIVLSGLNETTPWSKYVGLTRPYFSEEFIVGEPAGSQLPDTLHGLRVAVPEGDVTAAYLEKKGAIPVRVGDLVDVNGPVAAPVWFLEKRAIHQNKGTKFVLFEKQHVIATPPGENGWLKRLGDYLADQKPSVPALIRREVQR
jgi:hypothetical protein